MTAVDPIEALPHNEDAEDWIIGSLLKRGDVIGDLLDVVEAADFHSPRHRMAFAAAVGLARRQVPIDYGTLSEEMSSSGAMPASEALMWLSSNGLAIPSAAHAIHYARVVARYATFRRLIGAVQAIAEDAYRAVGDLALSTHDLRA